MADSNPDSIKRYTPPVHRNRANNRRKAGDRAEKANYSYNNDGEKSHVPSLKNLPPIIHHDAFVSNAQNDYSHARLVPLEGCSASEASQLLSEHKPVMYAGSGGSSWGQGHMKLPHQMNFLEDLRRAVDAQTGLAAALSTWN
ncbi:hypothetical protein CFC21_092791 [Triticum aestivum]|uniref:Uncharacterized protein n=2 Tax=Triticum aestivum TaxID=4565 RepID=A0A9R1LJD0_WHEAT|nr:hypothetical protein CFC21_092791 [Triticum aestivum]